ncbi:DUF429 domain-containing protein [Paraconexibacter algicola]|nr:DUF429 domain-containing protein [Paraconexibacter algicola]
MTSTLGVDLASQDKKTALCEIAWERPARVVRLELGVDDAAIVAAAAGDGVQLLAIDAPFGWPEPFVRAVRAHHDGEGFPVAAGDRPGREPFYLRETDRHVIAQTGKRPLSVSTDKIAYIALRCAGLLRTIGERDPALVPRDGSGLVAEVYPGAALVRWAPTLGCPTAGYRGAAPENPARTALAAALLDATGVAADAAQRALLARSEDALDAFVTAVLARVVALGRSEPVPDALRELARREGWIHVPRADALDGSLQE